MRTSIASAVSCVMVASLAAADFAAAAIVRPTRIPAQSLVSALEMFARDRNLQLVYATDEVGEQRTAGAVGELSASDALTKILQGTGLAFQFLDDHTVTVQAAARPSTSVGSQAPAAAPATAPAQSSAPSLWARLRLAQVSPGSDEVAANQSIANQDAQSTRPDVISEIIVTAQKRQENLHDVPISISVLGGAALDRSTFTGALEALRTVPGVALLPNNGTGGGTMINIRGVGAASAVFNGSSPIGYYLDAVPFSLIRDAINPDQSSFDLERIEVLRGPQGTLYGASSMNGLVRVVTKDADLNEFEFKARTTLSKTDGADDLNYRGDAAVNVPLIAGALAVRAVVGYDNAAGWIENTVENDVNDTRTRNYRLKVNAQPTDALSIGLSAWVNRGDKDALSLSGDDRNNAAALDEPATEDFETYSLQIGYELPSFSVASSTSYLDYKATGSIDAGSLGIGFPTFLVFTAIPSESFSQEVILSSSSGSAWKWTLGAFYRDIESGLLQEAVLFSRPISFSEESKSAAVFGEVGRRFWNDEFEWTLGARYFEDEIDHELDAISIAPGGPGYQRQGKYSATTPRAVLTWYPSDDLTIYASYSQGFRSGLPVSYTVGLSQPDFPDTKPDKLSNYEIGAKIDVLDRRLSFDAAIYYVKWRDVQQSIRVPFGPTEVTGVVNGESASGAGVDFSIIARPSAGLELGLNAGWNDLTIDGDVYTNAARTQQLFGKGDRLNVSPELTSGVYALYDRALGASGYTAGFSVSVNYVSEMDVRQAAPTRALIISGDDLVFGKASVSIEAPSGWSASAFVDNFTNEYGAITSSSTSPPRRPRPRPRTIGVQFDYRFD